MGNLIIKGSKKHKVTFKDEVWSFSIQDKHTNESDDMEESHPKVHKLCDIKIVENLKDYNRRN